MKLFKVIFTVSLILANVSLFSSDQQPTAEYFRRDHHLSNITIKPITLSKDQIKIGINGRELKIIDRDGNIVKEESLPFYVKEGAQASLSDNVLIISTLQKSNTPQTFEIPISQE